MPSLIFAGSFRAVPVKLYLDAKSKTTVLKLINEGDEKMTVQLNVKEWNQNETGNDVYKETKDIVFFPEIADVAKGKERVVRIGYQGQTPVSQEKTYRLFAEELPIKKPGELALKFAIRFSIPIFFEPTKEVKDWTIDGLSFSEEALKVKIKNNGNSHVIASKIIATGFDDSGKEIFSREKAGWYVLAGITKPFDVDVSVTECTNIKKIKVAVEVEKVTKESTLNVDKNMCTPKKKDTKDIDRAIKR